MSETYRISDDQIQDQNTGEQVTSHEAIIVNGGSIGDSLQPNCADEVNHLFKIPLQHLYARTFRVQALLEDCCNDKRGIMTSDYTIL